MAAGSFFAELRRRNVIRMAGLYLVAAWLITQVAGTVLPMLEAPTWVARTMLALLAIGFIPALIFAWVFEITPEGLKRESEIARTQSITPRTGRRMDRAIIVVLALAIAVFAVDRFVLVPRRQAQAVAEAVAQAQTQPQTQSQAQMQWVKPAPADAIPEIASDPSIAVLPFANRSSDKDQEYFSDGISEELMNLLAKIPKLRVIARTSSFSFKGANKPIDEIARTLHVAAVLEGSVQKAGDKVRISTQLIRASDGTQLWSEIYDRTFDDIFKIQDEIAATVAGELQIKLLGKAPKSRTTAPEAWALYQQALQLGWRTTAESLAKSDALFRQVLALDPSYAPACFGLARNAANEAFIGILSSREGHTRSREWAQKALVIDPAYAAAHARLGNIASVFDHDMAAAAGHFQRALALDATDVDVLNYTGHYLMNLGRLDEAQAVYRAALRRDPTNLRLLFNQGRVQFYAGHYDEAIASLRRNLDLSPGDGGAHFFIGWCLLYKGDAAGALAETQQETSEAFRDGSLPMVYHALGDKVKSDAALKTLIDKYANEQAASVATVYAYRGEADQAFAWLEKSIQNEESWGNAQVDRTLENLRDDPRWLPFLRKIGYAPAQLAKIDFKVTLPE